MELFVIFSPLIGAMLAGFGWKILGEKAAIFVSTSLLFFACFVSWFLFLEFDGELRIIKIFKWMGSGSLQAFWAIRFDRLTAIMLIVVTTVSALVHLYSVGYMDDDPNWSDGETYKPRFFCIFVVFHVCNVNVGDI
jgi:NADH-quinone oxidoreductase subunit L